jgi:hypothetical protein
MKDARRQTPDANGLRNGERVRHPDPRADAKGIGKVGHLGRLGLPCKAASQTGEHSLDVLQLANDRRHVVLVGHPQEHGHKQVGLQLRSRTQCDIDKPAELAISEAATSLGDVGCDRHRRPPTLRNESESFRLGEPFGDRVDALDDDTTSLPDFEFPKVLHPSLVQEKRSRQNVRDTHLASGVWRLASSVSYPSLKANPSATPPAVGVWRLASGVSSYDPAANLS